VNGRGCLRKRMKVGENDLAALRTLGESGKYLEMSIRRLENRQTLDDVGLFSGQHRMKPHVYVSLTRLFYSETKHLQSLSPYVPK
jgi:hypothetical protein